jgi:hypothetical protein
MGLCKIIVSLPRGKSTIEGIGIVFFQKIQDKVYRHWFLDSLINSLSGGEWRIRIPQKPRQKTEAKKLRFEFSNHMTRKHEYPLASYPSKHTTNDHDHILSVHLISKIPNSHESSDNLQGGLSSCKLA